MAALKEETDAHPKTVVFTHFAATQQLVIKRLAVEGIAAVHISAGASQAQRARALHAFTSDPDVSCFVLSMRAAAVGLTLTCASRLVLLEPGLNLADEAQAIGRVHRFGQVRPVRIVKFAIKGSIEEKILDEIHTVDGLAAGGPSGGGPSGGGDAMSDDDALPADEPAALVAVPPPSRAKAAQQALSVPLLCRLLAA